MVMENSTKLIPTLTPTFEQWKSLAIFLTHHETSLQRRFGAVKILPPSRWAPLVKNPYDIRHIKLYIKQEIIHASHQSDVFYIQNSETLKRRSMTYDEFKTIAESDPYRLSDTVNDNVLDYFWSTISKRASLYVPNVDDTLFAKRETVFNMTDLSSLLKYYPQRIPGVTTPVVHMGMWSSAVGIHIDEYDLISLNYLHHGAAKIWYIIHPSCYSKFEELVNKLKLFSDISSSCLSPLQHKSLLIKPSFLDLHSIEYYRIEQKLNELVAIFPGTYHCYFDTGFNLSETIKYGLPSWLQFQRRSPRLCSCKISSSIFVSLNRRFFTNEILSKFQTEYLTSTSSTYVDLAADEDNNANNQSLVEMNIIPKSPVESNKAVIRTNAETEAVRIASHINISFDQLADPLYSSSSSSTNSNTPISPNLLATIDTRADFDSIANIFEEILAQTNSNSMHHDHHPTYFHPYERYSPIVRTRAPSVHTSYLTPYTYSALRMCTSTRHIKRRRCYGCRQQGHLRKECPYFPHN
ncbi:unnamed protein product [Rotaria socialis]|uniref:CCHC-type domain-containing protein n=3 Tax=Rotaria socialis TaxID=392032 RepID=A0A817NVA4_9BILA|nr:unnamed protein product [Rotaria socialis]CAF3637929.1 unnamed protein product [Rotaria socialis]CAF4219344.1 unnamed protein product [Rotaria socialis]CAF4311221.1 unnamed protein product [Rotaria socialis]